MKIAKKATAALMTAALATSMSCVVPALASAAPAAPAEASSTYTALATKTVSHDCAVGDKHALTFKVNGKKVKASKVTWKSSNTKIATVSKKGVLTAKKFGEVTITGKYKKATTKYKVIVNTSKGEFESMVESLKKDLKSYGPIVEGEQNIYGNITTKEVEGGTLTISEEYNETAGTLTASIGVDATDVTDATKTNSYTIRLTISDKYADKNCTIVSKKDGETVKTITMKKNKLKSSDLPVLSDDFGEALVFALLEEAAGQQFRDNIVVTGILVDLGFTCIDK